MKRSEAAKNKAAASRLRLPVDEYRALLMRGLKWCTACRLWHRVDNFARDASRGDGLKCYCRAAEHRYYLRRS